MNNVFKISDFLKKKVKTTEQEMFEQPQNDDIHKRLWRVRVSLEQINKLMQELKEQSKERRE